MSKKNKLFVRLFFLSLFAIIIGGNLKVNGNEYAEISIIAGLLMQVAAILGLLIHNFPKWKQLFN